MGIIELGAAVSAGRQLDVAPLQLGAVCATVDTRGAPSALVTIERDAEGLVRRVA